MKGLLMLLLLAGCAANEGSQPSSFNTHMNGSYVTMGGVVLSR
jgi:hypothetical protein